MGGVPWAGVATPAQPSSLPYNPIRGKGGRGLRGLAPWRSLRQRLMRAAFSALVRLGCIQLSSLIPISPELLSARLSFTPVVVVSPRFHPHSDVAVATVPVGVLDTRGAAISDAICGVPVAWFPTISPTFAVTPTRRFRISRRCSFLPKPDPIQNPYAATFPLPLALAAAAAAALRLYCGSYTSPVAHR
jgi:hypothetical protein